LSPCRCCYFGVSGTSRSTDVRSSRPWEATTQRSWIRSLQQWLLQQVTSLTGFHMFAKGPHVDMMRASSRTGGAHGVHLPTSIPHHSLGPSDADCQSHVRGGASLVACVLHRDRRNGTNVEVMEGRVQEGAHTCVYVCVCVYPCTCTLFSRSPSVPLLLSVHTYRRNGDFFRDRIDTYTWHVANIQACPENTRLQLRLVDVPVDHSVVGEHTDARTELDRTPVQRPMANTRM
jgi:hypothetical protein